MTTTASTTMTMSEEWRPVVGYEDLYEVSDQGRVRRIGGDMLKAKITGTSPYQYVTLCKRGHKEKAATVHRLVALAFIPNPENKPLIDHLGAKTDNRASMLRWATHGENNRHRGAFSGYKGVSWVSKHKKWYAQITVDGTHIYLGMYDTEEEAYHVYCAAADFYHGEFAHG